MAFGGQTVTFVVVTKGPTPGDLGTYPLIETPTPVKGCRHRPMTFEEIDELDFEVATEVWKTTAPPHPAVLAAKNNDVIREAGVEYQIIGGVRPYPDMEGRPFKVTIISQKHRG